MNKNLYMDSIKRAQNRTSISGFRCSQSRGVSKGSCTQDLGFNYTDVLKYACLEGTSAACTSRQVWCWSYWFSWIYRGVKQCHFVSILLLEVDLDFGSYLVHRLYQSRWDRGTQRQKFTRYEIRMCLGRDKLLSESMRWYSAYLWQGIAAADSILNVRAQVFQIFDFDCSGQIDHAKLKHITQMVY